MRTDSELLRQHVEEGSEAAFTEIIRRYAGLVYRAALRMVEGNVYLAEDIAQDVFILLARKAPRLVGHETLAGWLHTTTRYVAYRMIRKTRRRVVREQEALTMQTNSAPEVQWEQLRPLLDEAVGQLDDRDRNAVLLRYFQGYTHREVGAALGLSENSAQARVDRALEKLRRHFARSGVVTTAALLAEALSANSAQAAPASLVGKIAAVAHAKDLGLGHVFLQAIYMTTKTKIAIATAVILTVVFIPFVVSYQSGALGQRTNTPQDNATGSPKVGQSSAQVVAPVAAPASPQTTQAKMTTQKNPEVDPRAPTPGVYPNGPNLYDLQAAAQATGIPISGADMVRVEFSNLFQKLQFTPEQIDAFIKIHLNRMAAESPLWEQYNADHPILPPGSTPAHYVAAETMEMQQLQPQTQLIEQTANTQLQQMLGDDNYNYYQDYTAANQERLNINIGSTFSNQLDAAGAPPLTLDQVEQLANLAHQNLVSANNSQTVAKQQFPQVLQQAGAFLTPEQIQVLQQPSTINALTVPESTAK